MRTLSPTPSQSLALNWLAVRFAGATSSRATRIAYVPTAVEDQPEAMPQVEFGKRLLTVGVLL